MTDSPKTKRTRGLIRALDLCEQLGVTRKTVYAHIARLAIKARRLPPNNALFLTPEQAETVHDSIRLHAGAMPIPLRVGGDRAATLLSALKDGKNTIDLVIELKATPSEAEEIYRWWITQTHSLRVSKIILDRLSRLLGDSAILTEHVLLELVRMRGTCHECGMPISYCTSCLPFYQRTKDHKNGAGNGVGNGLGHDKDTEGGAAPSPMDRVIADEEAFQKRHAEAMKRAGLEPKID